MWPEWLNPISHSSLILYSTIVHSLCSSHTGLLTVPWKFLALLHQGLLLSASWKFSSLLPHNFFCPACPYSAFGPQTTFHFLQTSLWLFSPGPVPRGMLSWCSVPFFHSMDHNCHEIFNYTISLQFTSPTELQSSRSMGAGTVFSSPEHCPAYSKQSRHLS